LSSFGSNENEHEQVLADFFFLEMGLCQRLSGLPNNFWEPFFSRPSACTVEERSSIPMFSFVSTCRFLDLGTKLVGDIVGGRSVG
jgi:hypothetical protein